MVTSSSDPEEPVTHDHTYVLIHLCPLRLEYIENITFQFSPFPTHIFPVAWAYPNMNQYFPSKSQSECLSVCPALFIY